MFRDLRGVVEQDGDGYVGTCYEVGICSRGRTVEEAFANLRMATWRYLESQSGLELAVGGQTRGSESARE